MSQDATPSMVSCRPPIASPRGQAVAIRPALAARRGVWQQPRLRVIQLSATQHTPGSHTDGTIPGTS
jgi:hypothetical protein